MTVETFDFTAQPLFVSSAAAEHFRRKLAERGLPAVRIAVKSSGCTGFMYVMEEVAAGAEGDVRVELDNGVSLFVAADAVDVLRGTRIEYEREGVNRTLRFRNPNVVAECGCGESFSVS